MKNQIFESHAHYDDKAFEEDREELIAQMKANGIEYIMEVGANMESSRSAVNLAKSHDFMYAAIGVHPSDIACLSEEAMEELKAMTKEEKVKSIGEIGLDYYWDKEPEVQKAQRMWFCRQLDLSLETHLPIIIHSRDAAADTFDILKEYQDKPLEGVVHCYSYSPEMAQEYVKMGYYIGVGGVVTFKNGKKLKETVKAIPIERILLETDSPYMAPEPNRGTRNNSMNIPYIAQTIAELKEMDVEDVVRITNENARRLFRIS